MTPTYIHRQERRTQYLLAVEWMNIAGSGVWLRRSSLLEKGHYFGTCPSVTLRLVPPGSKTFGMENNVPPRFGGEPGTPVPQVDLDDIKASLQLAREVEKRHPDGRCQIGASLAASVCKPGADVPAIGYRLGQLGLIQIMAKLGSITQDTLGTLMRDGEFTEQTLRTIATIPMEWMGVGIVRQGPPYDFEEFLRLAA
jgi:hypothetical protein